MQVECGLVLLTVKFYCVKIEHGPRISFWVGV